MASGLNSDDFIGRKFTNLMHVTNRLFVENRMGYDCPFALFLRAVYPLLVTAIKQPCWLTKHARQTTSPLRCE